MSPLQEADLIFPSASQQINTTIGHLRRANLSITNRLRSISQDADFVQQTAAAYGLPLIANERCGSWYIPPHVKKGSAYFKSTDGHTGQWALSLRRLNLQVLEIVGENGGCVIVDSTRRGKSMPDALSKTVPIWICALNRLLFPNDVQAQVLFTPKMVVTGSEHVQIESQMHSFVAGLQTLALDLPSLRSKLKNKPMRPVWVTPDNYQPSSSIQGLNDTYHSIVLCTASSSASVVLRTSSGYVQGAADDSESWAFGLEPPVFWAHQLRLLSTAEDDLPETITKLTVARVAVVRTPALVSPTSAVWVANNAWAEHASNNLGPFTVVASNSLPNQHLQNAIGSRYIHIACTTGKLGSRKLRTELAKLNGMRSGLQSNSQVMFTCPTGRDLAVGVALAFICLFCDESGATRCSDDPTERPVLTKAIIKQRLSWIMVSLPDVAPSRATLQSVNDFLLG